MSDLSKFLTDTNVSNPSIGGGSVHEVVFGIKAIGIFLEIDTRRLILTSSFELGSLCFVSIAIVPDAEIKSEGAAIQFSFIYTHLRRVYRNVFLRFSL